MKEIKKISNCNGIAVIGNNLFSSIRDSVFINDALIGDKNIFHSIYEYNGNIYCFYNSTLYQIIENKLIEIFKKKGFDSFYVIRDKYILLHKRISRKELYYELCDFNNTIYWDQTADQFISVISTFFKVDDRLNFSEFTIKDIMNNTLWKFSLPEDFQLFGSILTIENVLYFHAVTWDSRRLHTTYGLDIETGKVLWQIEDPNPADLLNKSDNLNMIT